MAIEFSPTTHRRARNTVCHLVAAAAEGHTPIERLWIVRIDDEARSVYLELVDGSVLEVQAAEETLRQAVMVVINERGHGGN